MALGAAYASYRHGQAFASRYGADPTTAAIWPLIVDGLLTAATVELWKSTSPPAQPNGPTSVHSSQPAKARGGMWAAWLSFLFGIGLSLCANIAAAPELKPLAVAVAACPPLSMLLAVELFNRALKRHRAETTSINSETGVETNLSKAETNLVQGENSPVDIENRIPTGETTSGTDQHLPETGRDFSRDGHRRRLANAALPADRPTTAEQRMWEHYWRERAAGHCPTGADLDRIAGTNNYGRRVLRRWHAQALLPPATGQPPGVRRTLCGPGGPGHPARPLEHTPSAA